MALTDFISGFQHIGIPTNDLPATIAFYEGLGFSNLGTFPNGVKQAAFLKYDTLVIEAWTAPAGVTEGAINHFSLDTNDVEGDFAAAKADGHNLITPEIMSIPTFWEHGTRFFKLLGPNGEVIEICQIMP